jgi:beta-fructofuranosidase
MLITARSNTGPSGDRGVIGHARSSDLVRWTVEPPLSKPAGFGHLEVPQVAVVDGQPLLLFCTNAVAPGRGTDERNWFAAGPTINGPWDIASARPFPHPHLYAPRLVADIDGSPALIGFLDYVDGSFAGELTDPIRVRYEPAAGLFAEAADSVLG